MNERIKDMLAKAHLEVMEEFGIIDTNRVAEKFAKLIVGECIRKIEDIAESSNDPQPIYRVAVELLEHFGVEV